LTESLLYHLIDTSVDNGWERVQVLGLGSVLIATVAFAAAFTIPGGYNQDNGTPVLARRYMFNAFILANALAFMTAFLSLFVLLLNSITEYLDRRSLQFAVYLFLLASSSMVVAFRLGM
jgi:Na+-transporting NADH:ubiquinone oxidoreductase subunit NqrD